MLKRIHVNQHNIKANAKDGGSRPVMTVKTYKENVVCDEVHIDGPSTLVYRPDRPLSCGARVWIETKAPVHILKERP